MRYPVAIILAISTITITRPAQAQSMDGGGTLPASAPAATAKPDSAAATTPTVKPTPDAPQSAQEIVSRHLEALGGKEKLLFLNSVYEEGVVDLPSGGQVNVKTWRVYDRLYRQEISFSDGNITIIATPSRGWTANPRTGGDFKAIPNDQLRALQVEIDPAGPLADYNNKGFRLEKVGTDTVDGQACYKIRVSCPSNHSITYFIDQQNWYILRETRKGGGFMGGGGTAAGWNSPGDGVVTIDYSDYRKGPGGWILPYSVTVAGIGAKMTINKIEINRSVDVDVLSRPRSASPVAAR